MIPKINFVWSFIYQQEIHSLHVNIEEYDHKKYERYVQNFIKKLEEEWKIIGEKILRYVEDISSLKWKREEIDCYVIKISTFSPISSPLTLPIQLQVESEVYTLSIERYLDMLIHELIHNLFIDNPQKEEYFRFLIEEKYKNEEFNTAIHVPIHALHKKIFLEFFDQKRMDDELEACSYYPAYKRSWEIVNKEGEDQILKELMDSIAK